MKLTDKQIAYFKERVFYWAEFFKLHDWQISCGVDENTSHSAYCATDSPIHSATIWISPEWSNADINNETLDRTALHEVAHILTADFCHLFDNRLPEQSRTRAAETFAVRMVNVIKGKFEEDL